MQETQRKLERIERLVEVRQSFVTAAESGVREAERVVRELEETCEAHARKIRDAQEEIAYLSDTTAETFQSHERYIFALKAQQLKLAQSIEKARATLEEQRAIWRSAMRDRQIVERLQVRRLHQWRRFVEVREQKAVDEMTVGRYARNSNSSTTRRSDDADPDVSPGSVREGFEQP